MSYEEWDLLPESEPRYLSLINHPEDEWSPGFISIVLGRGDDYDNGGHIDLSRDESYKLWFQLTKYLRENA